MSATGLAFTAASTFMNWLSDAPTNLAGWVANGRGRMSAVHAGGETWPVSLGEADQGPGATWLTSMASALFGTPRDEIARSHDLGMGGVALKCLLGVAETTAVAASVGATAIVNNTLLSVSPVGDSRLERLAAAVRAATQAWPERMVGARGIIADPTRIRALARNLGGFVFPNRISYAFDLRHGTTPEKVNAARDIALLRKAKLECIAHNEFSSDDIRRAHAQYTSVYINRHGGRNPKFTADFFAALHASGVAPFAGLKQNGQLAAFVSLHDHDDFTSVPLIGYQSDADLKLGLYRQIFALALQIGAQRRTILNFGAGAGHYKKLRGGAAAVEYLIVVPPRTTWLGRSLAVLLEASQAQLDRLVPRAISTYGG
jgi:hypothetical protein